jgi:hypothetical protein
MWTDRRRGLQAEQALQDTDLDYADHGSAFIALQLNVAGLHDRDDAAATIDARRFVRNDWHPGGQFGTALAVHE